jgi:cytochrome oxidase Cu insertion factor (SCO1/SenC/PrrC family)
MSAQLPGAVAAIPLEDSSGHRRTLSDFAGKVVVISDTMTLCQETCPIDTASLVQIAREADRAGLAKHVEFLTITVDPGRDTPPQLAAYRKLYAPAPSNWMTLTGTPAHVDRLWKYLGVYHHRVAEDDSPPPKNWRTGRPLTYDIEHSDEVFFVDAAQKERFILEGMPQLASRREVPAPMVAFLSAEGRRNLTHPSDAGWSEPQARTVLGWLTGKRVSAIAEP